VAGHPRTRKTLLGSDAETADPQAPLSQKPQASLKHGSTHDGDLVLINTTEGSEKHKNVLRNPRVALDICDPANAFNVAVIRGRVKEVTFKGADEHVDKLAKKYLRQDKYQSRRPGMRRVLFKIEPVHIVPPFTDTTPRKST